MDTYKENRQLLVDNDGKRFTVLCAYLPDQRMWKSHWIFQTVIPALLGQDVKCTKIIITDGDSQEITQLDNAILWFFPQVFRQCCGWHLITHDGIVIVLPMAVHMMILISHSTKFDRMY